MRKVIVLTMALLALSLSAQAGMNIKNEGQASGPQVTSMTMGDYGLVEIDSYELDAKEGQADVEVAQNVRIVQTTDTILVHEGVRFGYKWTLNGTPEGAGVQVQYKVTEATGNVLQAYREKNIGDGNTIYYMCTTLHTCPPGDYVVEVIAENGVSLRKVFHLRH